MSMHIERVDTQIVSRQVQTIEHLSEGEILFISIDDDFVGTSLHLGFDESQHVLLVH